MSETAIISIVLGDDGRPISHPMVYDIVADRKRPVTQADVDRLLGVERAFNKITAVIEEHRKPPAQVINQANLSSAFQYLK